MDGFADIKDFVAVEHIRSEGFDDFSGQVDAVAKAYEQAKAKDDKLASGGDV